MIDALGTALGFLVGSILRIRRRHVEEAMARIGVDAASAMYRRLGIAVVELACMLGPRRRERLTAEVVVEEELARALDAALARGSVVIAASHTGHWELAAFAAARFFRERGRAVHVVAKALHVGVVQRAITRLREAAGVHAIAPAGALALVARRLDDGDVVVMPIDQVPDRRRHAERVTFLGAPALVDRAPATVAARAGATLVVVASHGRRLCLLAELTPARATIRQATRIATEALDAFVRAHPSEWLWMHRRWRLPALSPRENAGNEAGWTTSSSPVGGSRAG